MRAPGHVPQGIEDSTTHQEREALRQRMSDLLSKARTLQTQLLETENARVTLIKNIEDYVADHIAFTQKHG